MGRMVRIGASHIGDRYRLVEKLGTGGMSVVWRAYDEILGRQVAVKVLSPQLAGDHTVRERLRQEALAAARLCHPNITGIFDFGESPPYVVMELNEGESLAARVARQGPLPWRDAVVTAAEVASALATAHARGVVHRDVTPANVMLTGTGAKVVDFGISALVGQCDAAPDGSLLGTPAYLAPERLAGGPVTTATDVYALGLLLYRALTARLPWPAENTAEALRAHLYADPEPLPPLPGLPDEVAALCLRCLAKDPADRPPAAEMATALALAAGRAPIGPHPVGPVMQPIGVQPVGSPPAGQDRVGAQPWEPASSSPWPSGPRSSGPRSSGPESSGPRSSGPRSSGPRSSGPRSSGPRSSGPRSSGPESSSWSSGPWSFGLRSSGPQPGGSPAGRRRPLGSRPAGSRPAGSRPAARDTGGRPIPARGASLRLRAGMRVAAVLRVGDARPLGGGLFVGGRLARDVLTGGEVGRALFAGRHRMQAAAASVALLAVLGLSWSSTRESAEVGTAQAAAAAGAPIPAALYRTGCKVRYQVKRDSGAEFAARLTIINTGSRAVIGWRVAFTYPGRQRLTAGRGFVQRGRMIVLRPRVDRTLDAGRSFSAMLRGEYQDTNPLPLTFTLNGHACTAEVIGAAGGPPGAAAGVQPRQVAEAAGARKDARSGGRGGGAVRRDDAVRGRQKARSAKPRPAATPSPPGPVEPKSTGFSVAT